MSQPAIGELTFPQRLVAAAALGTLIMSLLASRESIHEFAHGLWRVDLLATVRFTIVAVVVLPLLPDQAYGPYGALNPFKIGVVIVLIAGISCTSYFAVRLLGARRRIGADDRRRGRAAAAADARRIAAAADGRRAMVIECAGNGRAGFQPPATGNQWTLGTVGCADGSMIRLAAFRPGPGRKAAHVSDLALRAIRVRLRRRHSQSETGCRNSDRARGTGTTPSPG